MSYGSPITVDDERVARAIVTAMLAGQNRDAEALLIPAPHTVAASLASFVAAMVESMAQEQGVGPLQWWQTFCLSLDEQGGDT